MKPGARRITIAATFLVAAVVAALAAWRSSAVRNHVEGWRFQLTQTTETITPDPAWKDLPLDEGGQLRWSRLGRPARREDVSRVFLRIMASASGRPVVLATADCGALGREIIMPTRLEEIGTAMMTAELETMGWRVLEQRFPRSAYVVIRDKARERTR
jgi:hypothetical protein